MASRSGDSAITTKFGACLVDASTGRMLLGQWEDDLTISQLRRVLVEFRPVEVIYEKGQLSSRTVSCIRNLCQPRLATLSSEEWWGGARTGLEISKANYFGAVDVNSGEIVGWPQALRTCVELESNGDMALAAFGGSVYYLQKCLVDNQVVPLGQVHILPDVASQWSRTHGGHVSYARVVEPNARNLGGLESPVLEMDAAALQSL